MAHTHIQNLDRHKMSKDDSGVGENLIKLGFPADVREHVFLEYAYLMNRAYSECERAL